MIQKLSMPSSTLTASYHHLKQLSRLYQQTENGDEKDDTGKMETFRIFGTFSSPYYKRNNK
jgi:hypothetical protein